MKLKYLSAAVLFLVVSSLLFAQKEPHQRFSISNHSLYGPGDKIVLSLYTPPEMKSFTFRLLRLSDPVALLKSGSTTFLSHNFDVWGKEKELLAKYFTLEREWDEVLSSTAESWRGNELTIKPLDKSGIYVLQALRDDQVAYCPIIITNFALIYKNANRELLAFVADAKTGEFIPGAKFNFYKNDSLFETGTSDKEGLLSTKISTNIKNNERLVVTAETDDELVFSNPYFFFNDDNENYTAYTYTNQPIYRPGQKVFFKSILRKRNEFDFSVIKEEKCRVSVRSPKNVEVFSGTFKTNEFGSIWGEFVLDNEAEIGNYYITVSLGEKTFYGSFEVEEYKKPEYKVEVVTEKKNYTGEETISGTVKADYYFGSPVTKAKVTVQIYKKRFWFPWWYWSTYSWFYRGFNRTGYSYGQPDFVKQIDGEVNDKGEFEFEFTADQPTDFDYTYEISASVEDASRRSIANSANVFVTRGAFSLSTSTDKYFVMLGDSIHLQVNAFDFSNRPVKTDFKIIVNRTSRTIPKYEETIVKLSGSTDAKGNATIPLLLEETGSYNYTVIAFDDNDHKISATGYFVINNEKNYFYNRTGNEIEILTDKDAYEKGDTLTAIISLPHENLDVLVSFEKKSFLGYKKYHVEGSTLVIKEKLTERFCQNFSLSVLAVHNRSVLSNSKSIGVLDKEKYLTLEIKPEKGIYKPGEKAVYNVLVKNSSGNPVANTELSLGLVDESIYAIREEQTENIQQYFYKPQYYYIQMLSSLSDNYYNTSSRTTSLLDKNLLKMEEQQKKGNLLFEGTYIFDSGRMDTSTLYFLLINNDGYFITQSGGNGKFSFTNIPGGDYDFCLLTKNGVFNFIKKIVLIESMKNFKIRQSGFESWEIVTQDIKIEAENGVISKDASISIRGSRAEAAAYMIDGKSLLVPPTLRKNFVDAALWQPSFVTNEKGEAKVELTLPDNLTSWRATVRGITSATEVGQETNVIIARKNLLVRTETPRFFREGDTLLIATNVHNYLNEKKNVKVAFKAKNLKLLSSSIGSSDEITVAKNGETRIDWKVAVEKSRSDAEIYVEALTDEESDAMQVSAPILPNGVKQTFALNAVLKEDSAKQALTFSIPVSVDLTSAEITFSLTPTLASTILKSIDELVAYPYGCVEQTMSRFLPAIIAADAFKELKIPLKEKTAEILPDVISKGLRRLYSFQNYDGGWGWWQFDKNQPYMTAYVVYGLSLAKSSGYEIDSVVFERGKKNLLMQLTTMDEDELTTIAFMFYSLAVAGETVGSKKFDEAKSFVDNLSKRESNVYALALFASAYQKLGDTVREKKIFARLMDNIRESDKYAYWGGKKWSYRWEEDKVQCTAFALKYLLRADVNNPAVPKIVNWLLSQQQGYSWNSTQQTAAVLFALTDYLKITKELEPDYTVSVLLNDEKIAEKQFTPQNVFEENAKLLFPADQLKKLKRGENKLSIIKNGKGALYFSGYNRYYINPDEVEKKNSFIVSKEVYKLAQFKGESGIVYKKENIYAPLKSGDAVFVKITVKAKDDNLRYFMLEDFFPSGFEIVKDDEHYAIDGEDTQQDRPTRRGQYSPWRWNYASKEIRDEKIAYFVTYPQKEMEFTYIIKAQIPGTFSWLPAEASLMYYPEVNGVSENYKLGILPEADR